MLRLGAGTTGLRLNAAFTRGEVDMALALLEKGAIVDDLDGAG